MPKFSVIIPTYNDGLYLAEALESVFAQTFQDYEVIVIDDGSTDATQRLLKPYMGRIHYVYQENQGAYLARNTGIRRAKGEFIAFLDADDIWVQEKLERQNQYLQAHPEIGMVHGYLDTMNAEGALLPNASAAGRRHWERINQRPMTYENILLDAAFHFDTCVIRKKVLDAIGEFRCIPVCEDFDFLLRVALSTKIGFMNDSALAVFRCHRNGFEFNVFHQGIIDVLKKHLTLVQTKVVPINFSVAARNICLNLSLSSFMLGAKEKGRQYFIEAFFHHPSAIFFLNYLRLFILSFLPERTKKLLRLFNQAFT